jgi:glycosyltransferase involved in cell wall biosynthesis
VINRRNNPMSPVRLLYLVASSRGGGAAHVRDLALSLDPARFTVQVAMPEDGGNVRREDFEVAGIPFHQVDIAAGFSPTALRRIRRLAAGTDILHVHGARAALFGRLAVASLGRRRPGVIYTIHGFAAPHYPWPRRGLLLTIERALAAITDRFIAVCRAEREALLAAHVGRPEKIDVVWNGIPTARFRDATLDRPAWRAALGVPPDALLVTTICRLYKPRDFDTLLRAFRLAADDDPTVYLLTIGDGPMRLQIEQQIKALSLAHRGILAGWRDDLPAAYAASDIYVLTTWGWEGLPLTVLEAMAAGLPVIATAAGGVSEAVVDGETGLLVARRDVDGLVGAFRTLIEHPARRKAMGAAGRARAETHFAAERMIAQMMAVYEHVLSPRPPVPYPPPSSRL